MASGQGSHWLIENRTMFHLCIARPYQKCVKFIFRHKVITPSVDNVDVMFVYRLL